MTDINRKISELRQPQPGFKHWVESVEAWHFSYSNPEYWEPLDWLGSDEANCRLLDEMPMPQVLKRDLPSRWVATPDWTDVAMLREKYSGVAATRREAVCLAWLKWKGETA